MYLRHIDPSIVCIGLSVLGLSGALSIRVVRLTGVFLPARDWISMRSRPPAAEDDDHRDRVRFVTGTLSPGARNRRTSVALDHARRSMGVTNVRWDRVSQRGETR